MNQSEKKKQTHLRCERQRREAINVSFYTLIYVNIDFYMNLCKYVLIQVYMDVNSCVDLFYI